MCSHRPALLLALASVAALAPARVRAEPSAPERAPPPELVAEAHFLCDPLPPGGRDVNVSATFSQGEPDGATGETALEVSPRVQLAMALGERLGFTADVGIATDGEVVDAPGASLKLLLRAPRPARTGLSVSVDLYGSTHSLTETEGGVGFGAIRSFGRFALRAGASLASGVSSWSPHLHAGLSGAVALGARWRVLAEAVTDVSGGRADLSLGPTVKLAITEHTALMAGALFGVTPAAAAPTFALQLTRSL